MSHHCRRSSSSSPNNITFFVLHKSSVANHTTSRPIATAAAENDLSEFSKRFVTSNLTAVALDIVKSSVGKSLIISVAFLLTTRLSIYLLGESAGVHFRLWRMSRGAASIPPELLKKKFHLPSLESEGGEPEEFYLYKLTVPQLKDLCRRYNEKRSGNKADLLKRLLDLSENRDNWKLFKPVAKRTHKGEQPGSKKSRKRARRRNQETSQSTVPTIRSIAHGTKDTRTKAEIEEQRALAREILAEHPEYSKPFQPPAAKVPKKQTLSTQIDGLEAKVDWLVVSRLQQAANPPPLLPMAPILNLPAPTLDPATYQHLPLSNPTITTTTPSCPNRTQQRRLCQLPWAIQPGTGRPNLLGLDGWRFL
ncbi:hypothetical protein MPER_12212 [Moniliophthora perniciosa FA553]|nr:hypothetical protein MPER_12212 [Moniliophthora perniciosa FA553]